MTTDNTPIETADDNVLQEANKEITEAYDKRVYTSNAFWFTSPGHLRTAAHLYGLESVPLENARVLELGCAGGGNLLPFAVAYPNAHIVGVDLSSVQINQGKQVVAAVGLKNLHLHAMSLTDITPDFGQFDYIIAHGVFSWVPPEVREAILRILRDNLSPLGIGYISYNTYPGWKAGDIVRDAMLLHSHSAQTEEAKLAGAKAMLDLLSHGISASNPLAPSLRAAVLQLSQHSDYYIAHEYLERFNNPCYLLEFVNLADLYNLTHAGDVEVYTELSATYGRNVQLTHSVIALGQPREVRQQYLDFAVGRNFRKSLLVRKERRDQILISPNLEHLADLRWAGHFTKVDTDAAAPKGQLTFRNYKNVPLHTNESVIINIVNALTRAWPASLSFDEVLTDVSPNLPQDQSPDKARLTVLTALQTLFHLNSVRHTLEPVAYDNAKRPATHPMLTPGIAHLLEQRKDPAFGVGLFNLWHETLNLQLKEAEAFVMPYLDGNHSRQQLSTLIRDALGQGIVPSTDGKILKGQRNLDAIASTILGKLLDLLQRHGLLL